MRILKTVSLCVLATALHHAAWAQIYETTDAQGNPEFTDVPPSSNAQEITLPPTNIVDAPPAVPQAIQAPQEVVEEQAPVQRHEPVIVHDANNDQIDVYRDDLRREREFERTHPSTPDEVLNAEEPTEIGDSDEQMPREIGDSDAQIPREIGDFDAPLPREEGDFSAEERALHGR